MPDDIKVAAGVGDNTVAPPVATDDIGGRHFQRIKAGWGAEGVFQETTDADGLRMPIGGGQIGPLTETAPASDTASSGLNGRLQRIAQRITSLIAQLPATLGQKTMANSLAVTLASDQPAQPVTGTFWQATQPVSGTVTSNAGTNTSTLAMTTPATVADGAAGTDDELLVGAAAGLRLMGFAAHEVSSTAPALFWLRHGTSEAGGVVVPVSLGANESAREWYGPDGIAVPNGIWLSRQLGNVQVIVYSKVVP